MTEVVKQPPEFKIMAVEDLRPFSGNPRRISESGIKKIQASIAEFGFVSPIIIQRRTNVIIAGHQRLKAAKEEGLETVPTMIVDLDDDEAVALNIADNRLQDESAWDDPKLAELLQGMPDKLQKLTGFEPNELAKIMGFDDADGPEDPPWVNRYEIVVECANESEQEQLYERLVGEGLTCRILSM